MYEVCEVTRTSNSTYGNIVEIKTDLVQQNLAERDANCVIAMDTVRNKI